LIVSVTYGLNNWHALVTGASSGIGAATALLLAHNGARVVGQGLTAEEGQALLACDLADPAQRQRLAADAMSTLHGRLDILVHCAGIYPQGTIQSQDLDGWRQVMSINVEAQYDLTRHLLPALQESTSASVVLVSSAVYRLGRGDSPAYTASKAAQVGLTRHLAAELGPMGIRVNCVLPGLVDTPGTRAVRQTDEEYRQFAAQRQWLAHVIQPDDVAHAVVFLCSPAARAITAACLDVNAGLVVGG
jgi:NAD(P)-dependent dehydrogenase (short-subunit alcohol dehydrogenase family)